MTNSSPKAISLFCGAGGCSLGFKRAGYDIIYASDIDPKATATYQENFPSSIVEEKDVNNLNFDSLLKALNIAAGEVDVLLGGPPCQGFSTAGTKFWDDPRNHLLRRYVQGLEVLRPKWFLMENVEGLLTSNHGMYVSEAVNAFVELGYKVRLKKVYAQEFGIPQRRKRVIIVGNRIGLDFDFPRPIALVTGRIFRNAGVTLANVIEDLPPASTRKGALLQFKKSPPTELARRLRDGAKEVSDHEFTPPKGMQLERIAALAEGQTMKDLPERLHHDSFRKRANRRVADGTPTEKRGGSPSGLKRLLESEPSLTVTSAATREFIHPTENRALTARECARIQTFPDTFNFLGTASDKIRQIGNAVPPDLAFHFAKHIREEHGFEGVCQSAGKLLGFDLTKATAMSPALAHTTALLNKISRPDCATQPDLFEINGA